MKKASLCFILIINVLLISIGVAVGISMDVLVDVSIESDEKAEVPIVVRELNEPLK